MEFKITKDFLGQLDRIGSCEPFGEQNCPDSTTGSLAEGKSKSVGKSVACLLATELEPLLCGMSFPNFTHKLSAFATIPVVQLEGLMKKLI